MSEKKIKLENRATLKAHFQDGSRPTANNFASLIDSMINKADDGILKNNQDGLVLAPVGKESSNVMSFSNKIGGLERPGWSISLQQGENSGLGFMQPISSSESTARLFFNQNGKLGVNTKNPISDFDVQGTLGASARIGTHKLSTVSADGAWHNIITDLNGCTAFEIMAYVGKEKTGRYALLHAQALSTFGRSRHKIRRNTQAYYGWWWNKISLRYRGETNNYKIQIRTRSDYGKDKLGNDIQIKFFITKLWDEDILTLFDNLK